MEEPKPDTPLSEDQSEHLREAWHEIWTSEPFGFVLILVFATFVFLESAPDKEWANVVGVTLQGATLMMALRAGGVKLRYQRATAVVIGVALAGTIIAVTGVGEEISRIFVAVVSALLAVMAPIAIARSVARSIYEQRRVTLQSIFGVVSVYFLLGMFFAFIYSLTSAIASHGDHFWFFAQQGVKDDIQNFLYFSFVTLTTVGYGDQTAAHQFSRTVAVVEALSGQLYLIIVLSVFVSNLRPRSQIK